MLNRNLLIRKNSLFNTVNLNKKKILKINFSQGSVQKKFGNFYSGIYANIYNNLFEKSIKKFYTRTEPQKTKNIKKSKLRFLYIFKLILNNLKSIFQILSFCFSRKKKLTQKKIIFQSLFDYSNQMSFWPIVKNLKKKDYYFLTKTLDYQIVNSYKKLYGDENVINIYEFYDFENIFKALYFTIKDYKKILFLKTIFYISNIGFLKLLINIYKNYYLYLIYLKVFKQIKQKKSLLMSSIGNEMFIAASKNISNSKLYGYAVQGVSFTGQSLTSQFLFNSLDKLFCYGNSDLKHFKNISKNNMFIFPYKIIKCGSVRDYFFSKNKKNKKNKKLKILYLRSNHIWFGDIDSIYLNRLSKVLKENFNKKFDYKIKERKNFRSNSSDILINGQIINKSDVLIDKKKLTEDLISTSDIIVGTVSTSIIYQSLYFKKLIIQFGHNNMPWIKNIKKIGLTCVDTEQEIIKIFTNLKNNKNHYKFLLLKQEKLSKQLIYQKKNPIKIILNELNLNS